MLKFKFAKLVRDDIVNQQISSGAKPSYRTLNNHDHKTELVNKIIEEAREIIDASQDEVAAEIADVQQAIDDLKEKYGLTSADIAATQAVKIAEAGAFKKGLFVDYVEIDKNNKWLAYYRKNADRYPEIQ
jgi:predicted house-cleaning noncanonical NTP pyrophosphatase (MazG superfamily)